MTNLLSAILSSVASSPSSISFNFFIEIFLLCFIKQTHSNKLLILNPHFWKRVTYCHMCMCMCVAESIMILQWNVMHQKHFTSWTFHHDHSYKYFCHKLLVIMFESPGHGVGESDIIWGKEHNFLHSLDKMHLELEDTLHSGAQNVIPFCFGNSFRHLRPLTCL